MHDAGNNIVIYADQIEGGHRRLCNQVHAIIKQCFQLYLPYQGAISC